jgi:hypothetical protein
MKKYKSILLAALLIFILSSIVSADCPKPGSPEEELKRAAAVFSGKVIDSEHRKITDVSSEDFGGKRLFIELKVSKWWKGSGDEEIVLRTSVIYFSDSRKEMAEDFRFSFGDSYLVYAFYFNGEFGTSQCTRTTKLSEAEKDLKELGEGFLPKKAKEASRTP